MLSLVEASGSAGITPREIRAIFNHGNDVEPEHERCIIAHALTQLHKGGFIRRSKSPEIHFNTYRYYPNPKMTNTKKTAKDWALMILEHHPGLTSPEIGIMLKQLTGKKQNHSAILFHMAKEGVARRESVPYGIGSQTTYRYWLADENTSATPPTKSTDDDMLPPPALAPALTQPAPITAQPHTAFAIFSDGRAIVEHQSHRIELTAADASKLRNMLNAAAI